MKLSDLELNPSATSPPTAQPTLPEKRAPFPSRFSVTGNKWRERLTLPGPNTDVKMSLKTAAHIYGQAHRQD